MHSLEQLRSGQLKGISQLKLSCNLTAFPEEIFDLSESLEILDLAGNQLSSLPDHLFQLKKLRILFLSDNLFTELPDVVGQCEKVEMIGFKANHIKQIGENAFPPSLRWLILTNNRIERLPRSIGKCKNLQKVALAGNLLKQLPDEMAACKKIELLRISANKLTAFPHWLLSLPRLSWLAFSGNEFNPSIDITDQLISISWNELSIKEQLGEGASGLIYKALWRDKKQVEREVAVKVFKGEVTSDGLPEDEMNTCIHAGEHPNLIRAMGKIINHPEFKNGLVLELIPKSYKNLGNPPSLKTCTRDTFPDQTSFSIKQIINIATGAAELAVRLHERGISHGDLYAHNILINENAHPLLSDFGAASFYNPDGDTGPLIQRLEVRAFGCLVEDLLSHCSDTKNNSFTILNDLLIDCMNENVSARPDFLAIHNRLKNVLPDKS